MLNQYILDPNNPPSPEVEARLIAAGVRIVLPTPIPTQEGMIAEEREAVLDGDAWRQVWELVPAPAPDLAAARAGMVLTNIQFAQVLMVAGILTAQEAEGWVGAGQIPALALAAIDSLPAEQRPFARIRFAGARTIQRLDPFILLLQGTMAALGNPISDEQLDEMFRQGAAL